MKINKAIDVGAARLLEIQLDLPERGEGKGPLFEYTDQSPQLHCSLCKHLFKAGDIVGYLGLRELYLVGSGILRSRSAIELMASG